MVSRGYETAVASRPNWISERPHQLIAIGWLGVLLIAITLSAQTLLAALVARRVLTLMRKDLQTG